MSYSQFFNVHKVYLDSYETENSIDQDDYSYIQPLLHNLILKLKRIMKKRIDPFLNNLRILYQSCLTPKSHHIEYITTDNDYVTTNQDIDIAEQIKILKIEILRSKLISLFNVIKRHLDDRLLFFMNRLELKIAMQKFFNKDDNYLYFLPKPKLFRFRNIFAYRRLLYVIKTYKYRINVLKRNFFLMWKDLIIDFVPKLKCAEIFNYYGTNSHAKNIHLFKSLVERVLMKKTFRKIMFILSFYYMKYKAKQLYGNSNLNFHINNSISNIFVFIKKLNNCFTKIKKNVFNIFFPVNYNNMVHCLSQEQIQKKENIFRGLFIIYSKYFIDKSVSNNFYKWKNKTFINSNKNNLISKSSTYKNRKINLGLKIIGNFISNNKSAKLLTIKRKFLENLIYSINVKHSLKQYGLNYNNIDKNLKYLSDEDLKAQIYFLRNIFVKSFRLKKLFLIINSKKYSFNYNIKSKNSNVNNLNTNDNVHNGLILCFYKWKKIIVSKIRESGIRNLKFSKNFELINNRINFNYKNDFLQRLSYSKKIEIINNNVMQILAKIIFSNLKSILNNKKKLCFNKLAIDYNFKKKVNAITAIRLMQLNKRYSLDNIIANNKLKSLFYHWKLFSITNKFDKSVVLDKFTRRIIKIKILILKRYDSSLKYFFDKFKFNARDPGQKVFKKSHHLQKIDFYLIQNQTKILLDYEREENKINSQILKYKSLTNKSCEILLIHLFKKHIQTLNCCFKTWRRKTDETSSDSNKLNLMSILNESINIQNENEALIGIYRQTKNNYLKVIEDFDDVKAHFCRDCIGEDFDVDYKSVNEINTDNIDDEAVQYHNLNGDNKENDINLGHAQHSILKTNDSFLDENFRLDSRDENFLKPNNVSLAKKVAEMEIKIKTLQNLNDNKITEYDNQLKTFEEKKNELKAIKEKILRALQQK